MFDPRQHPVIDGTCPPDQWVPHYEEWIDGGFSACVVSMDDSSPEGALTSVGEVLRMIAADSRLILATSAADLRNAHATSRLAVMLQFQSTAAFGYNVDLVSAYAQLGLRIVGLAYNQRFPVGDGCEEASDAGLSQFGRRVVAEMNRTGILVDFAHTGWRTCADALEASAGPCITSHSNAHAVHAHPRNLPDDILIGIAESGGVIGMNGFPAFVSSSPQASLDQFIDHIVHIDSLVGTGHVGLGLDYSSATQEEYDELIESGAWTPDNYPAPPWLYPAGIERPSTVLALAARLDERGYSEAEVAGVLGENWMRLFERMWPE